MDKFYNFFFLLLFFSFGSILPKDTITNTIFKDNGGIFFINKLLVEKTKEISNESFLVDFNLLKDDTSEEDQNVIVLALDKSNASLW